MSEFGEELSKRELDVLNCVAQGASNKEAAKTLSISQNTVKVHLRRIYTKLGVSSRTEAATVAIQQGLVTIPGMTAESSPEEATPETSVPEGTETTTAVAQTADPLPAAIPFPDPIIPQSSRSQLNWRMISLTLAIILGIVGIGFITLRLQGNALEPTAVPFVETALGERWASINRPLAEGTAHMAMASVGLNVYRIGGETAADVINTVHVYNATNHTWQEVTAKPTAVADATAAVLFGEVYVPGGRLANGEPTDVVEVYSPVQNAWRPIAALPQPIVGGLTLSDGVFIYLFGGWNGTTYLDTVYVYDPGADSWRPLTPSSHPRAFATGGFVTSNLYVVGGTDDEGELAICQAFDPTLGTWFDCPHMLQPRAGAGAAAVLNKLYVIGGGIDEGADITYSELYDPVKETWQVVNTPILAESPNWPYLGVTNIETRIYVLGGQREAAFLADSFVFAPLVYQTFLPGLPVQGDE